MKQTLTLAMAASLGLAPLAHAAVPQLQQTEQAISGHAVDVGMDFKSVLLAPNQVTVDIDIGLKRVHAEIDYTHQRLAIHSISRSTGGPVSLALPDIVRFYRALHEVPATITVRGQHAEALGSVLSYIADAPLGQPLDIEMGPKPDGFTYSAICTSIGKTLTATYTVSKKNVSKQYRVGPMCYVKPAFGRCGMAAGPDPVIGVTQKFTQECLDHDACCFETGSRIIHVGGKDVNVCGFKGDDCVPQFRAAAPGFFFAPSCAQTEGTYSDSLGHAYKLTGGPDGGLEARAVNGSVTTGDPKCPTDWKVAGSRKGQTISLTAKSPKDAPAGCVGSFTVSGAYTDCNIANGTFANGGNQSSWSWTRTSTVQ